MSGSTRGATMAKLPTEYRHEPRMALAAGQDGLDLVRRILAEAPRHLRKGGGLVCEIGRGRAPLERAYPTTPFVWLDTEQSQGEVFWLSTENRDLGGGKFGKSGRVAQADAERPGGADQRPVRIDRARAADHLVERHVDHAAVPPADHAVGLAGGQQVDRPHAERRGEQPVLGGRLGAALDMTQHGGARLRAGRLHQPMGQPFADALARRIASS